MSAAKKAKEAEAKKPKPVVKKPTKKLEEITNIKFIQCNNH